MELQRQGLVVLTWGNVSGLDRTKGIFAIKPSGVPYSQLTPDNMVLVDLEGSVVDSELRPSSDTPTQLDLYSNFKEIGGMAYTHSTFATAFVRAA